MPGAKRTDHISRRDLEILNFIARFGVVPRTAVAAWAGTARTVTICREARLRDAGLIRVLRGYGELGPIALATNSGLGASGHRELSPARVSFAALSHDAVVAELAARLERDGERLLSERQIVAREQAAGERILSASLSGGRFHRADLIRLDGDEEPGVAIEVELSTKGSARLDQLLRAWRNAALERRIPRVVYRCAPRTLPYVLRAVERTRTESVIEVEALWANESPPERLSLRR